MNYQALQDADEEMRTTMFKKIEADLEDGLTVNDYQLPIVTRMRQGTSTLHSPMDPVGIHRIPTGLPQDSHRSLIGLSQDSLRT